MEKRVADSIVEQTHLLMSSDLNGAGRLFGGRLLQWIDETAGIVARRYSGHNIITACIDNLQFKAGAYLNDVVVIIGRVTYTGNTSMEVRVDSYVEDIDGKRRPINRAYVVMVAMDSEDHPTPVPKLLIETESEKAEWQGALKRKEYRKQRRIEGF
jgi:acyl-CoA hydrolase